MAFKLLQIILILKISINWERYPHTSTPPEPRYHPEGAVHEEKNIL